MRALILILAAACATSGAGSYGSVTFKSAANYAARPVTFSVGKGHLSGSDLDVWLDGNCIRGAWGRVPVDFCRDDKDGQPVQHWSGSSGVFTVTPAPDHVSVTGYWNLDTGRTVDMTQEVRIEQGPQWVELRKNPALLAVAANAADLQAAHLSR